MYFLSVNIEYLLSISASSIPDPAPIGACSSISIKNSHSIELVPSIKYQPVILTVLPSQKAIFCFAMLVLEAPSLSDFAPENFSD